MELVRSVHNGPQNKVFIVVNTACGGIAQKYKTKLLVDSFTNMTRWESAPEKKLLWNLIRVDEYVKYAFFSNLKVKFLKNIYVEKY